MESENVFKLAAFALQVRKSLSQPLLAVVSVTPRTKRFKHLSLGGVFSLVKKLTVPVKEACVFKYEQNIIRGCLTLPFVKPFFNSYNVNKYYPQLFPRVFQEAKGDYTR